VLVAVSVDTEEDNWGSYERHENTTENIGHLPAVQEIFDRCGARPTYLVNFAPLRDPPSVHILGRLGERPDVEVGAHCHPWNTPPFPSGDPCASMMWALSPGTNRDKVGELRRSIEVELGVRPTTFRSGRWSFGPSVAVPLAHHGFRVDASVTPFLDWSSIGGPDYTRAPHLPYRFDPSDPLRPNPDGKMVELPTTVGFLKGSPRLSARVRHFLERSLLANLRVVGFLDSLGILERRWLSPERSSSEELVQLAEACVARGQRFLDFTFHSSCLLPGATPYVRDDRERAEFLAAIEAFLRYCSERGWTFATLGEVGEAILCDDAPARSATS